MEYFIIFAASYSVGLVLPVVTYLITRPIRRRWLRSLLRAAAIAFAFMPTLVPDPRITSGSGILPLPALFSFYMAIFGDGNRFNFVTYGVAAVTIGTLLLWPVIVMISRIEQRNQQRLAR